MAEGNHKTCMKKITIKSVYLFSYFLLLFRFVNIIEVIKKRNYNIVANKLLDLFTKLYSSPSI